VGDPNEHLLRATKKNLDPTGRGSSFSALRGIWMFVTIILWAIVTKVSYG